MKVDTVTKGDIERISRTIKEHHNQQNDHSSVSVEGNRVQNPCTEHNHYECTNCREQVICSYSAEHDTQYCWNCGEITEHEKVPYDTFGRNVGIGGSDVRDD